MRSNHLHPTRMRTAGCWLALLFVSLLTGACEDGAQPVWRDPPAGEYGVGPAVMGVIATDYASSSLAVVDLTHGQVRSRGVLHSGSKMQPGMTALSGDVVFGSGRADALVLVDRARAVVTELALDSASVRGQLSVATGFFANPSDAVLLDGTWWVPRAGRNPNAATTPDPWDDGDDLLWFDDTTRAPVGRIGFADLATLPGAVAGPQRVTIRGDAVWIPLGSFAKDFRSQGTGRLVQVSRTAKTIVASVDLAPWKNCVSLLPVEDGLAVACMGSFADGVATQLATSALLHVSADPPHQVTVLQTAAGLGSDPFGAALAKVGSTLFFQTMGSFDPARPDRVWQLHEQATTPALATEIATGAFAIGGMLADEARAMLWVSRRDQQGDLLRFRVQAGTLQPLAPLSALPQGMRANALGLP